jgi:hypothetical protein
VTLTQLDPPIPLHVVGRGPGLAHLVIDYGPEHHLLWVIFLDADGSCWTVRNPEIRGQWNVTMGRNPPALTSAAPRPEDD